MELRVVRVTDRFDEACRFFAEVLGWPVTKAWDEGGRGRVYGYGDVGRVELLEGRPEPVSGVFVSFEVADADEVHDRCAAAGLEITQPPTDQPWGHRNVAVREPSGMTFVAFQVLGG